MKLDPCAYSCEMILSKCEIFLHFPIIYQKKTLKLIICETIPALVCIETSLVDLDFTNVLLTPSLLIHSCAVKQYANPSHIWDLGAAA